MGIGVSKEERRMAKHSNATGRRLTGPLGLTTTLGGRWWTGRCGVVEPALFIPLFRPAGAPMAPCCWCCANGCPAPSELGRVGCPGCRFPGWGALGTLSLLGNGLFRGSMSCVCEEVGVPCAELAGDWVEEPACEGDAVPDVPVPDSFFLDEDLLDSLALESCWGDGG